MHILSPRILSCLSVFFITLGLYGQSPKVVPYYPSAKEVEQSYIRQNHLDSLLKAIPLRAVSNPNWDDDSFWYIKRVGLSGQDYEYVKTSTGIK